QCGGQNSEYNPSRYQPQTRDYCITYWRYGIIVYYQQTDHRDPGQTTTVNRYFEASLDAFIVRISNSLPVAIRIGAILLGYPFSQFFLHRESLTVSERQLTYALDDEGACRGVVEPAR